MAGSRPGERRGGRQKGTRNKRTQEKLDAIAASGLTPLDYLLSIMRDDKQKSATRMKAAIEAMPYVHAKLAPVDKDGKATGTVVQVIFQGSDIYG